MQRLKSENSALKIKMAQKLTTGAGNRPGTHRRRNRDGQGQGKEDFNLPTSNLVSLTNLNISLTSLNGTPNIDEFSMISNFIAHKKANCENVGDQFFRDLGKYLFSLAPGKEIPQRSKRTNLNFENHNDSKDCKDENVIAGVEKLANDLEYDDLEYRMAIENCKNNPISPEIIETTLNDTKSDFQ